MTVPCRSRLFRGVVAEFDDHAGFGEIEVGSGGRGLPAGGAAPRYWFHCTQIADGSRHVEPGRSVTFQVVPGHLGRWEATAIS